MNTDTPATEVRITQSVPQTVLTRNEYGLLVGAGAPTYVFNEDGYVNWRKMISPKWLVPNKQKTKETDVSKLEDKDLLILLPGIKELARIRGFTSVSHRVTAPSGEAVFSSCSIHFLPNYETQGQAVEFSAIGDATYFNTNSFGKNFLGPIAENRAFVRCVRNFLQVNIVGYEEINPQTTDGNVSSEPEPAKSTESSPVGILQEEMDKRGVKFEHILARLKEENYSLVGEVKTLSDIPGIKILELIARVKKVAVKSS